jgi:IPT/TIG domain-containing protein
VGLFAEPATLKLKDIFDTLFTPRHDPRDDRSGQGSAAVNTIPTITKLDPTSLSGTTGGLLNITGTNFGDGSSVHIGTAAFTPKTASATELTVEIAAKALTAGTPNVTVMNKSGGKSAPVTLTVT